MCHQAGPAIGIRLFSLHDRLRRRSQRFYTRCFRFRLCFSAAERWKDAGPIQFEDKNEAEVAAHHEADERKHNAINAAPWKPTGDGPHTSPNENQDEERAYDAQLDPDFLRNHFQLSPRAGAAA